MTNIWDFNCCGEFKATMKIIQAIFDLGELEKAAKQGKIIRRFLVRSRNKTRFGIFRTFFALQFQTRPTVHSLWHVRILHQFITAYVDQTLISTGAARITAAPPFGFSSVLHTAATVQFSNQKTASENDFSLTPVIASVVDLPDVSLHKPHSLLCILFSLFPFTVAAHSSPCRFNLCYV